MCLSQFSPANSFSLPFAGSFTSSTMAFILLSVLRSYFGRLVSCGFSAISGEGTDKGDDQKDRLATTFR